jgi:2,3-bisphosphoglycerate-independent phosphoglycerate mutase
MDKNRPLTLIILDGWGLAPKGKGNAVTQANTPNMDRYWNIYPHTKLQASGSAVGLPKGEPGNSEAGHTNIGAGRIIYQSLPRINMSIADGSFFKNSAFLSAIENVKNKNSALHLMGLIGGGGVHSSIEHIFALLRLAADHNIKNVYLHLFTDGRDSPPTAATKYLEMVEQNINKYGVGKIATLVGRFYAMDRDQRWERIQIAYDALTKGKGTKTNNYKKAIEESYEKDITDEHLKPIIITENNQPLRRIKEEDSVIFFNYRIDRPRELTKAFVLSEFETLMIKKPAFDPYAEKYGKKQYEDLGKEITTFKRDKKYDDLVFATMTEYEPGLPVLVAFPPTAINMPFARFISEKGWRQFHIAETEKERHVTYYFDGKREDPFPGEDRLEIPSPKEVKTYDEKPEMSAKKVTKTLLNRLDLKTYDFVIVNFANPDMVGHTGDLKAGVKACQTVDSCLGKVVQKVLSLGGVCFITADHGNVEEMINPKSGDPSTQHSANLVPFIIASDKQEHKHLPLKSGILGDIAPTILKIAGVTKPNSMSGKSLI